MFKKLLVNIGTGYVQKIIQVLCGLVTVPVLVSDKGLGLAGYGQLAVALSLAAMLSMSFDGFRLVTSKTIGRDTENVFNNLYHILMYMMFLLIIPISLFLLFSSEIFILIELDSSTNLLMKYICIFFALEQLLYVSEQYFHSQFKTFLVNFTNSLEAIIRMLWIISVFKYGDGDVIEYFIIFNTLYFIKLIVYQIIIILNKKKNPIINNKINSFFVKFIIESLPLSMKGGVIFLVFRLSIILSNKYLSSEAAAIFSFIFVTLRGYLAQIFVSVLRPMIIPYLSRKKMSEMSFEDRNRYKDIFSVYELFVLLVVLMISMSCTIWLPIWLGSSFDPYLSIISFGIGFIGIECAFSLRNMALISQGHGNYLTILSIICCLFYVGITYYLIYQNMISLNALVFIVSAYLFAFDGISVNYLYNKKIIKDKKSFILLFFLLIFMCVQILISGYILSENYFIFGACQWLLYTVFLFFIFKSPLHQVFLLVNKNQ